MKSPVVKTAVVIVLVLIVITALHALAQQAQGPGPGGGFPGMMGAGWPPSPMAVVVLGEGVVYVACDGKLTAFEAKTLNKLGEATYWEREPAPQ